MARKGGPVAPEGFFLPAEAAVMLGTTTRTLRRWRVSGTYVPKHAMQSGGLQVNLYSEEDIEAMKELVSGK